MLSNESLKKATGGTFTASYVGSYGSQCGAGICTTVFYGRGGGTFIGRSRLRGKEISDLSGCSGGFKFQSRKHRADTFRAVVSCIGNGPYNFTVYGGTGKFANASGGGTVSFSFVGSAYTFTSSWTGTLYY
jgi:hypothetical protein